MTEEAAAGKSLKSADIARIMKLLPHRYPFLLIDRMIDIDGEQSGTGIKNVTINEPFFQGHFPGAPVWKYWAEAHVGGKKVAEAEIGAMLMDRRGGE